MCKPVRASCGACNDKCADYVTAGVQSESGLVAGSHWAGLVACILLLASRAKPAKCVIWVLGWNIENGCNFVS